ncbi:hypothetical protein ACU4GD_02135 [Cupriavidus basilensis]
MSQIVLGAVCRDHQARCHRFCRRAVDHLWRIPRRRHSVHLHQPAGRADAAWQIGGGRAIILQAFPQAPSVIARPCGAGNAGTG